MNAEGERAGRAVVLDAGQWTLDSDRRGDEATSIAGWLATPMIARVLGRTCLPPDPMRAMAYLRGFDGVASHLFMIRRTSDGHPEGMMSVNMDGRHLIADLDVVIGARTTRSHDGHTLLEAAGRAAVRWAFLDVGMQKIMARVLARNARTADWAGRYMRLEGTLRGHVRLPDGSRHDVLQYGLLRDEWQDMVASTSR